MSIHAAPFSRDRERLLPAAGGFAGDWVSGMPALKCTTILSSFKCHPGTLFPDNKHSTNILSALDPKTRTLFFFSLFIFPWPYLVACGILVPQSGIKPGLIAVKAQSRNHWTAREFPTLFFLLFFK